MRSALLGQAPGPRTYVNPMDIDYKYNFEQLNEKISYRQAADPVILNHRNEYYLFATVSGGYWHSKDLGRWRYVVPNRWPFEEVVAPSALSVGDTIYLLQSAFSPRPILSTKVPATGRLEFYNRLLPPLPGALPDGTPSPYPPGSIPPGPWDPQFFHDRDDRSAGTSTGARPTSTRSTASSSIPTKRLTYIGKPQELFTLHPEEHGWERFGRDHTEDDAPYHGRRVDDEARREVLPPVRGARAPSTTSTPTGPTSATAPLGPIHLCALQPDLLQAGRLRDRAPATATRSRTTSATGGTPAPAGSA